MPAPFVPQNQWETDLEGPLANEPGTASAFRTLIQKLINRTERLKNLVAQLTGVPFDGAPPTSVSDLNGRVNSLEGRVGGYLHTQLTPSNEWIVNHNLGYYPNVSVFNLAMEEVEAEIYHYSTNQVRVRFEAPYTGYARCV